MKIPILKLISIVSFAIVTISCNKSIVLKTEKEIGETITLRIWAKQNIINTVWIDFNNNKQKDDDEHIELSPYNRNLDLDYTEIKFPLKNQVFSLHGNVIHLNCDSQKITEISFFNNSLKGLDCSYNQLKALDVTKLSALEKLECYRNQLTKLDISKNQKLENLNCRENQLTTLNLSKNKLLQELQCSENQLATLDISNNKNLKRLDCASNKLTQLNISKNKQLLELRCSFNKITQLNTSENTELRNLSFDYNLIKTIDLSRNLELYDLLCSKNKLKHLDISQNIKLENLGCDRNLLTQLDIFKNKKLTHLSCDDNRLTKLDISQNKQLKNLYCDDEVLFNSQFLYDTSAEKEYETIAERGLIIREYPSTRSKKLGKIEFSSTIKAKKTNIPFYLKDEEIEDEEIKDFWYEIEYNGEIAFVFGGFLNDLE